LSSGVPLTGFLTFLPFVADLFSFFFSYFHPSSVQQLEVSLFSAPLGEGLFRIAAGHPLIFALDGHFCGPGLDSRFTTAAHISHLIPPFGRMFFVSFPFFFFYLA